MLHPEYRTIIANKPHRKNVCIYTHTYMYNAARGKQKRNKQKQRFGAADRVVVPDGGTVGKGRTTDETKPSKATNRRKANGKHRKSRHHS